MKHMLVLLQRQVAWAINFAVLAAFCALAARWTWQFLLPGEISLLPQSEAEPANRPSQIAESHLFGNAVSNPQELPAGLRLDGIFAPHGDKPGAAIFVEQGKGSRVVQVDEEVYPGYFLEEIARDHVVLRHGGARVQLRIEQIAPELDLSVK